MTFEEWWGTGSPYEDCKNIAKIAYNRRDAEIESLRQQLAERDKQIVMLRDLIPKRIPGGFLSFGKYCCEDESLFNPSYRAMTPHKKRYLSDCEEALTATDDLKEQGK